MYLPGSVAAAWSFALSGAASNAASCGLGGDDVLLNNNSEQQQFFSENGESSKEDFCRLTVVREAVVKNLLPH